MRHVIGASSPVAHRSRALVRSFGASAPSCVVVSSCCRWGGPMGGVLGWLTSVHGCPSL